MAGYPDGTFRPSNNLSRGQLSKIVANAAGLTGTATDQRFEDVPPGSPFFDYVDMIASQGIINGYDCGGPGEPCIAPGNLPYFRPGYDSIRGQIAKVVSNAAGLTGMAVQQRFEDVPPSSAFYEYVDRLASRDIVSGYACGSPNEPCVAPDNLPYYRPSAISSRGQISKLVSNTFFPDCTP